ncbi:MAG: AI-2E family transporter [Terriglobales bacterium]
MTILDSRTSRVILTALLFALTLGFLYAARRTLILFLFAILFAYLINPAVGRLEKIVRSRVWAITIIYLLLLLGLSVFGFLVGPRIARQSARLGESLPGLMDKASTGQLSGQIGQLTARIGNEHGWSADTQKRILSFLLSRRQDLQQLAQRIGVRAAESAQEVWVLFLVPILAIFFLRDGGNFHEVLLSLVQSRTQREFLQDVLHDLNQMLAQFIRAQLTLAALSLIVYTSILGAMRVPYALMLGTAGGALEFVPGLRHLSPHHGRQRRIASSRRLVRNSRRRRNRRNPWRLSFHPSHGQPAHRLAALAYLRRKTQVRTA